MKKICVFVFCTLLSLSYSFAKNVTGYVVDSDSLPLPGALVTWVDTNVGTVADTEGHFSLHHVKDFSTLVVSYPGFQSDTLTVPNSLSSPLWVVLSPDKMMMDELVVYDSSGNFINRNSLLKTETVSFAGLTKMACCNLSESFENSASISVGYSDAVSGSKQIKMLGLSGTYTRLLDESRPVMRGLGAPYSLNYTPGVWLNSIQVSKGISSVSSGHDDVTGAINLDYRKPTDDERLFANFYLDDDLRAELNLSSALPVANNGNISTVIMAHGSTDTDFLPMKYMDRDNDGFRDTPFASQVNLANRWFFILDNGMQIRVGVKYVWENRLGGMLHYKNSMRPEMEEDWHKPGTLYGSHIANNSVDAYIKIAYPLGTSVYNRDTEEELRSSLAIVGDYEFFSENAYFGLNDYNGKNHIGSLSVLYNHYFAPLSSLKLGFQGLFQNYMEYLNNYTPWVEADKDRIYDFNRHENEIGAYAEYNWAYMDKINLSAGVRGDYNTFFKKFYGTPRLHMKYNITPSTTLRASGGLSFRTVNIVTDNIGILSTGRPIEFLDGSFASLNRIENSFTVGASASQIFRLFSDEEAMVSLEYFRTQIAHPVIADAEYTSDAIMIYRAHGNGYTNSFQIDFTWTPFKRFDVFATFRYTQSMVSLLRPGGNSIRIERPLVSKFKGLLNLQYSTKFRRWVFDATAQLNGPSRIPSLEGEPLTSLHSTTYPVFFAQVTHKIGKFEIYLGCENIGDYRQKNPIVNADEPFSLGFNAMNIWGPLMGRKIYAGFRMNLY